MSEKLKIKFKYDEDEENSKTIEIEIKSTIESLLKRYLAETNSKIILDPDLIMFLYGTQILNVKTLINLRIEQIFNRQKRTVTVLDANKIIGGKAKKI